MTNRDLIIVGGGPVGAALSLALGGSGLSGVLLEARSSTRVEDPRAIALSYGSKLILERLGVWADLALVATPITTVHVSQRDRFGRCELSADESGLPALGYTVAYGDLYSILAEAAQQRGLGTQLNTPVSSAGVGTVSTPAGEGSASLVVLAEGGRSLVKDTTLAKDYQQSAVIASVASEIPHKGRAYERFTPDGPIALLPSGGDFALVWTTGVERVEARLALSDTDFLRELNTAFGDRQGRFIRVSPRTAFPLKLALRGPGDTPGLIRIGNAAQQIHPVAGQGFNLGLRDAWRLAETLLDVEDVSVLGSAELLAAYRKGRGFDAAGGARVTDIMVELFSNDWPMVAQLRGVGLAALDVFPVARQAFARKMMFGAHTW